MRIIKKDSAVRKASRLLLTTRAILMPQFPVKCRADEVWTGFLPNGVQEREKTQTQMMKPKWLSHDGLSLAYSVFQNGLKSKQLLILYEWE